MSSQNPPNLVFDDLDAAVDALEVGVNFLEQGEMNAQRLRWAVIAIHQALQCFMVTALRGTEGGRPLAQKSAKRLDRRLDKFLTLYAKVKDSSPAGMGQLVISKAFEAEAEDDRAICYLNWLRNRFIHFKPHAWVLDPGAAIAPLRSAVKVINFLAFESQNILWRAYPHNMRAQTRRLVARGSRSLDRLSATYIRDF